MIWFDMLAIHPHPKPLESFTGYLLRLAHNNALRSKSALSAIAFPSLRRKTTWTDLPRQSYGALPVATGCTTMQLHATTFYHLLRKFQRSLYPATAKIFLADILSLNLRYCPLCLTEFGFYKLSWRFTHLLGCEKHGVYLLNRCGHCGASVSLMPTPLQISFCPTCGENLQNCLTQVLTQHDQQQTDSFASDLNFLLSPQAWENDPETVQSIAPELRDLRRKSGWSQIQTATHLGITLAALQAMENRKSFGSGETFAAYLGYLGLFKCSFSEIFFRARQPKILDDKQYWLERVQKAISTLKHHEKPLTQQAVCHLLHCDATTLQQYPEIQTILRDLRTQHQTQKHEQLLITVQQAVTQLQSNSQKVNFRTVASLLGRSASSLRYYPAIRHYIQTLASEHENSPQNKMSPLASVKTFHLTQPATSESFMHRQQRYFTRVKYIVEQMTVEGIPFSIQAVARRVGMSAPGLRAYPQIIAFLRNHLEMTRATIRSSRLSRVEQAVQELQRQHQAITQYAVAQHLSISTQHLRYHTDILDYLTTFADYNYELRVRQQRERETTLYESVTITIQQMRSEGRSLNQSTLAAELCISVQRLKAYPSIRPIMKEIAKYAKDI